MKGALRLTLIILALTVVGSAPADSSKEEIPCIPAPMEVIDRMLEMAKVGKDKVLGLSAFSAWLSLVMFFAFACGTGRTFVLKHPEAKLAVSSVTVSETTSLVSVPKEGKLAFRGKLEELLYGEAAFERGAELNIRYYFVQYDSGNQLTRLLLGGIGKVGEGSLVVAVKFFDVRNNELGSIRVEGRIDMGYLGGDFRHAIEKAAEEVAEYTILNFRSP